MKRIGHGLSIVTILMILLATAFPAQAFIYAGKRKRINCGVVLLNNGEDLSAGVDCNGIPYLSGARHAAYSLFSMLNARQDLKPAGWSLENPHSPGGIYGSDAQNRPEYWFVNLHTYKNLSDMHVLYLPAAKSWNLDDEDCQKLREFVDSGGVLWIDNVVTGSSGALDFGDSFFVPNFFFSSAGGTDVFVSRHHPVLTLPFWLSESEIASLGVNAGKYDCNPGYDQSKHSWGDITKAPLTFDILYPIVKNTVTGKPSVAANAYGSGRVIATANAVGPGCLMDYPYNLASLKFAYNVLAWSASWTHMRKDPRHSGSSIDTVGGTKLIQSWSFDAPAASGGPAAPVIYKNVVFYTSGSKVYALDLVPDEDLDQDGNPDDGYPGGAPAGVDVVWVWNAPNGETLSAPSLVTAQDPADPGQSTEAIMVMSSAGVVYTLPAFPNAGGILIKSGQVPFASNWGTWDTGGGAVTNPYPPLYLNGWIYAVAGDGKLRGYNPSLEAWGPAQNPPVSVTSKWSVPNQPDPSLRCTPKAGPAFAWVSNDATGALVGTVYWAGDAWPALKSSVGNDFVYGAPVFVSHDRLRIEKSSDDGTLVECRIALSGYPIATSPKPIVVITDGNGHVIDQTMPAEPNRRLNPAGVDVGGWILLHPQTRLGSDAHVVATYAIDYSRPEMKTFPTPPTQRWLEPMSNTAMGIPPAYLTGTPALGSSNMIYMGCQRSATGPVDSLYAMRNDASTGTCKWNYELHGEIAGNLPVTSLGSIPGVVFTEDTTKAASDPARVLHMNDPRVYGSPAVAGGKVFVAVSGTPDSTNDKRPSAAILCLKANPEFVVRITEAAGFRDGQPIRQAKRLYDATGRELSVRIWQPDLLTANSPSMAPPPIGATQVTKNLGMIDYDKGTITFDTFERPKLRGLAGANETNTFTPSLPVWVYIENVEVPIDFSTYGPSAKLWTMTQSDPNAKMPTPLGDSVDLSQWNNLLWYYVVPKHDGGPCKGIHSSPVVIGNSVYFVCDDGYLYAIPTETDENSGGQMKKDQLIMSQPLTSSPPTSTETSIAGSNGVLVVPTANSLVAYTNATTLVADSGRVMEVDGSGEATWSVDTLTWPATIPPNSSTYPSRMSGPVNKPSGAKYTGPGEVLLINTGANQVLKIDKSGSVGLDRIPNVAVNAPAQFVRWMWDKFTDPKHLLRSGQPTELREPTDALFWREWEKTTLVIHCLIADSGNHRVLDLVYRLGYNNNQQPTGLVLDANNDNPTDPATGFYLPELNWVSVTDSRNESYTYECLQLVPNANAADGQWIWAAVSNYRTGTSLGADANADPGKGLGGAVVALKYRIPVQSGGWNYASDKWGQIVAACDKVEWSANKFRPLAQPKYFQVMDRGSERFVIICDNYGVYEIGPLPTPRLVRAFTDGDYRAIARTMIKRTDNQTVEKTDGILVPLKARSVQELRNGNWLIANEYAGANTDASKQFSGEIFELDWSGSAPSITWSAPSIYCECDAADNPLFDTWAQDAKTTYKFLQPVSGMRQF
jgi:hypothetical protein